MKPGERLGDRFELEQPIGSGGMGTVYRALDPISGQAVAVKVISHGQDHRTERFAREVKLLAGLSHPGIVELPPKTPPTSVWSGSHWAPVLVPSVGRGAENFDGVGPFGPRGDAARAFKQGFG